MPFRKFLSPKNKFYWDDELDKLFIESKELIIASIHKGVRIFDPQKPTCLRTDWSKRGIGYFLLQKQCSCDSTLPDCCLGGWAVTLAGSRFLNGPEERYAAIEGEALAIAWSLEQTRYFTQGCNNLVVVTDHKPLIKIFSDRTLDEIDNNRLFRQKQRTLPWHYRIAHLPGKTNHAADALSRHPHFSGELNSVCVAEYEEHLLMAAISKEVHDRVAISWSRLVEESIKDPVLNILKRAIREGFSGNYEGIAEFTRFKSSLYIGDSELVFYQDRVIIPSSLRSHALKTLHSAHQGVSSMERRAHAIIFWPGITNDIQRIRDQCAECNTNAPSQAPLPAEPTHAPVNAVPTNLCGFLLLWRPPLPRRRRPPIRVVRDLLDPIRDIKGWSKGPDLLFSITFFNVWSSGRSFKRRGTRIHVRCCAGILSRLGHTS